jgi:hypothetical protein
MRTRPCWRWVHAKLHRVFGVAIACVVTGVIASLPSAAAAESAPYAGPLFDAHMHYSVEAAARRIAWDNAALFD